MRVAAGLHVLVSILFLGAFNAPTVAAQTSADRVMARQLGEAGEQALDAKDYKTAEDDFRRADTLVHAPTLMLGLARALAGEGKLLDAQEAYKRIIREGVVPGSPAVFQKALDDAKKEVASVSPRIGSVTITVKTTGGEPLPPNTQITWDGAAVNVVTLGLKRPADPGSHVLHVAGPGYKAVDLNVTVPTGDTVNANVLLAKDDTAATGSAAGVPATEPVEAGAAPAATKPDETPATSGAHKSVWPWVAFGIGGAGLVTGAITGALFLGKHSDLSSHCSGGTCPSDQQSNIDSYNTLGLVSSIGFAVAGVGAATGVVLLLVQPKEQPAPASASAGLRLVPVVSPSSVGLVGRF